MEFLFANTSAKYPLYFDLDEKNLKIFYFWGDIYRFLICNPGMRTWEHFMFYQDWLITNYYGSSELLRIKTISLILPVYSFKAFIPVLVAVVVALLPSRVSSIKGSPSLNEISVLRTVVSVLKYSWVVRAVLFMKILLYGVKSILVDFDNINRNNRAGKSSSYHPYTQSLQKLIKLNRKTFFYILQLKDLISKWL